MQDRDPDEDDFVLKTHVVGVHPDAEPFKSIVVGDDRSQFGRRLGAFALALLILFFAINGYIQSIDNARLLKVARGDRTELVRDVSVLTDSISDLTEANKQQTMFIRRLQRAIRQQNLILRRAGFQTVRVPATGNIVEPRSPDPNDDAGTRAQKPRQDQQKPKNEKPDKRPDNPNKPDKPDNPNKPDDQGPVGNLQKNVCELTGICL